MTGRWVTQIVLRRRWHDGTEFTIRGLDHGGCHLTITSPTGLRAHSWHPDINAARAHADELIASLTDPNPDDYRITEHDNNTEQLQLI